jgi:hypothetical protein
MAALFAATYPERVYRPRARSGNGANGTDSGSPWALTAAEREALVRLIETGWGTNEMYAAVNPSIADDHNALEAYARFFRLVASPGVAAAVTRMLFELDIRDVLPTISAPTLVVHRRGNPVVPPEAGRDVARRIPGAKFVEVPGQDYGFAVGDVDVVIDEVEEFLTGSRPRPAGDRALSTILITDIVDSEDRVHEVSRLQLRRHLRHERRRERASAVDVRRVISSSDLVAERQEDRLPARAVRPEASQRATGGLGHERRRQRPAETGARGAERMVA